MMWTRFDDLKLAGMYVLLFLLRVLLIACIAAVAAFVIWQISLCYDLAFSWEHAIAASIGIAVILPREGGEK